MAEENIDVKKQQEKSPKAEMNAWLTKMGLIGDEFTAVREVFTKNLTEKHLSRSRDLDYVSK